MVGGGSALTPVWPAQLPLCYFESSLVAFTESRVRVPGPAGENVPVWISALPPSCLHHLPVSWKMLSDALLPPSAPPSVWVESSYSSGFACVQLWGFQELPSSRIQSGSCRSLVPHWRCWTAATHTLPHTHSELSLNGSRHTLRNPPSLVFGAFLSLQVGDSCSL